MREEVKKFAEEMEKVLHENDYKGGWSECECAISYLHCLLNEKIEKFKSLMEAKLVNQIDSHPCIQNYIEDIQKQIIDIANYCMMIHERLNNKIYYKNKGG